MAEEPEKHVFEFDLGDYGDRLRFSSPDELIEYNNKKGSSKECVGKNGPV